MEEQTSGQTVTQAESGQKLIQWLQRRYSLSSGQIHKLVRTGQVRLNGRRCKAFDPVQAGDRVRIPPFCYALERETVATGQESSLPDLPPEVVRHGEIIAFNKPAGLPTQSGSGHQDSLAARLAAHAPKGSFIPAPAHRLDRDTTGILLVGTTFLSLRSLTQELRKHEAIKEYLAWVNGIWSCSDVCLVRHRLIREECGGKEKMKALPWTSQTGKEALLLAQPLQFQEQATLLHIRLLTGRTHQIRVQMAALGFPVCGDKKYGSAASRQPMRLHCLRMTLASGESFACPPPWQGKWALHTVPPLFEVTTAPLYAGSPAKK